MIARKKDVTTLALTRLEGEALVVDGPARIGVFRAAGGRCRLWIEAPRTTTILRDELAGTGAGGNGPTDGPQAAAVAAEKAGPTVS